MSTMRSQRLAVDVHRVVEARAPLNDGYPPRYASRVRNLSVWIRENGLIQTLMFIIVNVVTLLVLSTVIDWIVGKGL